MTFLWYNLLLSIRNLIKNKFYLILNISCLAIGLAASLLIYLWINHELSYDRFFQGYKDVFRVVSVSTQNGELLRSETTPADLGKILSEQFPEIEATTIYHREASQYLKYKENTVNAYPRDVSVDFFKVIPFHFTEGNSNTAFSQTNAIVITQHIASKLFGNEPAVGKVLSAAYNRSYIITGVVDLPENSHFDFDFLTITKTSEEKYNSTYIRLKQGVSLTNEKKLQMSRVIAFQTKQNKRITFQPVSEIYLNTSWNENGNMKPHGSRQLLLLMGAAAFFILLIASLNYLNLSTALAIKKRNEVGIQKVIGALRWQIVSSFITEFLMISILAFLLALYIAELVLPIFNSLVGLKLSLQFNLSICVFGLLALIITCLLSVSYPAFYVASLPPEVILKQQQVRLSGTLFRNIFVGLQFAVSLSIILSALLFNFQMRFIQHKDLGFHKENIITMGTFEFIYSYTLLRDELLKNPNVVKVSASVNSLSSFSKLNVNKNISWEGKVDSDSVSMYVSPVDPDFLEMAGLTLVKGEFLPQSLNISGWFRWKDSTFQEPVVINETAAHRMGFADPIGKRIGNKIIIGVVKDFHFQPLEEKIEPLLLCFDPEGFMTLNIRINPVGKATTIAFIEKTAQKYSGDRPVELHFLEDEIRSNYDGEMRITKVFNYASALSTIIAILGLLTLVSYITESRRKEISIRKVNGAMPADIGYLIGIEFVKIISISFGIACPFVWFFMRNWLSKYAYHIHQNFWIYILVGMSLLLVSMITVFSRIFAIAKTNPINHLRNE